MSIKEKLKEMTKVADDFPASESVTPPSRANMGEAMASPLSTQKKQTLAELRARIDAVAGRNTSAANSSSVSRRYIPQSQRQAHAVTRNGGSVNNDLPPLYSSYRHEGREVHNAHGSFFLVEETLEGSHRHGDFMVSDFSRICTNSLAMLADQKAIGELNCSDALFLDLETTGLSGGAGTFPFMIGIGWLADGKFVVQQLFSRDHSEEKASLAHLLTAVAQRGFLITFNGKAYDVNLLATRLVLNRFPNSLDDMPHLDLLYSCRRVFKHRLEDCSLSSVEGGVLGFQRGEDIPGMEIPQRYFAWLRRRDPALVSDIFYHNRLDIISMVGIALSLSQITTTEAVCSERDLLNMERLKIQRTDGEKDLARLLELAESADDSVAEEARETLSAIYKRDGNWEDAHRLWLRMLASRPNNFLAVEELAKYYEHRERRYLKAIDILEEFIQTAGFIASERREIIARRLKRLNRKINEKDSGC
ncbi:MAG: ribonuclease H-like domain-containing protein [Deltaproteobacteria bacterium]|nr:ribonuclease H-like domain-containing protein [Deltaproteobacteria bacterium]